MQRFLLPVAVLLAGLLWQPVSVTVPEKAEWTLHHEVVVRVEPVNANVTGIPSLSPLVPPAVTLQIEGTPSVDVIQK